jgi:ribonuclease P protein component
VVRNRAKRRLREAIRVANLPDGNDFVVIAGPGVSGAPFPTLVSWVSEAAAAGTDRRRQ